MRKKLATVTAHCDQNGHSQPWPGPWLSCDLAVTEPWSYWRCSQSAMTSPWLSCDLAVTELWPSRDWAVTLPWLSCDLSVYVLAMTEPWSLSPRAVTTVSSSWAHGDHLFSHGMAADDLAKQGARASATMILTMLNRIDSLHVEGKYLVKWSVTSLYKTI